MYYPYLRGKQFELIALREFADLYDNYKVIPIIEPVKAAFNSMVLAVSAMKKKGLKFVVILNPQVGDIIGQMQIIETGLADVLPDRTVWSPAFIVNNNNHQQIITQINNQNYQHVFLICKDNLDTSALTLAQMIQMDNVTHIVSTASSTRIKRLAQRNSKSVIRLDDNFIPQRKNSDFLSIPEEMFTEEYNFFSDDGYDGISDYTVLPSEFVESGMGPVAVAIHWTYEKNTESVWVRHFVSDTNVDRSNVQGKFAEAARKAVEFLNYSQPRIFPLIHISI
ncbi:MAG: sce7725 family protein [Tannerella sp.]|jgi:hypothetical protein|nr:sce7725 family protein [Tannerella sp.]